MEILTNFFPLVLLGFLNAIVESLIIFDSYNQSSRKKRIAKGSGTTIQEVNQLMKQFALNYSF